MKKIITSLIILFSVLSAAAQTVTRLDSGWKFALGNAADPAKDFGRGTEYFNYLTKAASIHNTGPYCAGFDDSAWTEVHVPHDWAATLPYDSLASHSHGYKTIGWKYPETSVGWYRLRLPGTAFRQGRHFEIRFDGIFRDANIWFNGVWLGNEPSGYAVQVYDITPYIDYDGENLLCVRADATFEEGWFYEGAGIYRNVWLEESGLVHPTPCGIWANWTGSGLDIRTELENTGSSYLFESIQLSLKDAEGKEVWNKLLHVRLGPQQRSRDFADGVRAEFPEPHLWSPEDPYLYTLEATVGEYVFRIPVGLRTAKFNATEGFLLNGSKYILKGVNLHQDHAGVGSAMPDGLIEWRIRQLKSFGVNAIRCSHNPASPALLDVCDRLGVLVIDENRLMGTSPYHRRQLENLVRFGRQHPSVILWSVGNEEWGLENDPRGVNIVREMQDYIRLFDPTRQTTAANAGGAVLIEGLQVHGYNYIVQNDVEGRHERHPEWIVYGSEETTGCGTRGVYALTPDGIYAPAGDGLRNGRMLSLNRTQEIENVIERGWKYYAEHPWTGGVFFWTGFDYRGEANPLVYPAVGSEFGLLDYCGFPKDEAYYLKAWWTDEPVLHVFPHWNPSVLSSGEISPLASPGRDDKGVDIWVYANCEEVELRLNGHSLGRKTMPRNGHLVWEGVKYAPGKLVATGYTEGKRVSREVLETTGPASQIVISSDVEKSVAIVTARVLDAKGRLVPDACPLLRFSLATPGARILGGGNGDPAWHGIDVATDPQQITLPAFNGLAQILVALPQGTSGVSIACESADF